MSQSPQIPSAKSDPGASMIGAAREKIQEGAADLAVNTEERLSKMRHRVARSFEGAAEKMRPSSNEDHNMLDPVRRNVAAKLDDAATMVGSASFRDLQVSTRDAIRRRPLVAMAAGLGIGILAGRLLRRPIVRT